MVLVIQHAAAEHMGTLGEVLRARRIEARVLRPYAGEPIPARPDDLAGLALMGGPQSVYDDRHPYLRAEIGLIKSALLLDKSMLGICLGSQLIGQALRAEVTPGRLSRKLFTAQNRPHYLFPRSQRVQVCMTLLHRRHSYRR